MNEDQDPRPNDRTGDSNTPQAAIAKLTTEGRETRIRTSPPWMRLTGAGLELAFIGLVFGGIGSLVDKAASLERPIGLAFGGLIGFGLGMFRFIRLATQTSNAQRRQEERRHESRHQQPPESHP